MSLLNINEKSYIQKTLIEVSRSFAVVIPCLEDGLKEDMAIAYLLCRVVDNIEDCNQEYSWQRKRFQEFRQCFLSESSSTQVLKSWQNFEWPGLTAQEACLMSFDGGRTLFQSFHKLSQTSKSLISEWCIQMANGMEEMVDPNSVSFQRISNTKVLKTEDDIFRYCYFVAGTVGQMGTQLAINHYGLQGSVAQKILDLSANCARALQMTNIVKDYLEDLQRGISYLPLSWHELNAFASLNLGEDQRVFLNHVINRVCHELTFSKEYITTLPRECSGLRMASLVCLLPALETIKLAAFKSDSIFTKSHTLKISKPVFQNCLKIAKNIVSDNKAIDRTAQESLNSIKSLLT